MFESFFPALRSRGMAPDRTRDIFSLMDDMWNRSEDFPGLFSYPAVDVSETDSEVVVKAELPGLEHNDLDVSVNNNTLLIKGEKHQEEEQKGENFVRMERRYGKFARNIPLPSQCSGENVKARFKNGVLTVQIPKDEQSRARRIEIES